MPFVVSKLPGGPAELTRGHRRPLGYGLAALEPDLSNPLSDRWRARLGAS